MATLVIGTNFVAGTVAKASEVNGNFSNIVSWSTTLDVDNFATLTGELDFLVSTTKAVKIVNNGTANSIDVLSNGSSTALAIANAVQLTGSKATILITDSIAQVTAGSAELKMALSASATIPAVDIAHGSDVTFKLTKTQANLVTGTSALDGLVVNPTHLTIPSRTTVQKDALVAPLEGSLIYDSTLQALQLRNNTSWVTSFLTGAVQTYAGFVVPGGWLLCDGAAVSRTTYAALFGVLSKSLTGTTSSTVNPTIITAISAPDIANIAVGWFISGAGIQAGTTVTAVGATTLTISLAATASATVTLRASPYGIGDGTTTFNVPDCRGVFVRGAGVQTISAKVFTGVLGAKVVDTTAVNGLSTVAHNHAALAPTFGANVFQNIAVNTGSSHLVPAYGGVANGSMVTGTTTASFSSSETETTPGNIALNYIIKT